MREKRQTSVFDVNSRNCDFNNKTVRGKEKNIEHTPAKCGLAWH